MNFFDFSLCAVSLFENSSIQVLMFCPMLRNIKYFFLIFYSLSNKNYWSIAPSCMCCPWLLCLYTIIRTTVQSFALIFYSTVIKFWLKTSSSSVRFYCSRSDSLEFSIRSIMNQHVIGRPMKSTFANINWLIKHRNIFRFRPNKKHTNNKIACCFLSVIQQS